MSWAAEAAHYVGWAAAAQDYLGPNAMEEELPEESSAPLDLPERAISLGAVPPATPGLEPELCIALQQFPGLRAHNLPELAANFEAVRHLFGADPPPLVDGHVLKIAAHYSEQMPKLHASKEAISRLTQVPAKKIEPGLSGLVSTLLVHEKIDRAIFEQALAASNCELLFFIDGHKFDETPMKVKVAHALDPGMEPQTARATSSTGSAPLLPQPPRRARVTGKGAATAKLLVTEEQFCALIKTATSTDGAPDPACRYLVFQGTTLTWVQVLQDTSAEVLLAALQQTSSTTEATEKFQLKLCLTTTDQHASNFLAEETILSQKGESWSGLHFPCNVHVVSRCHSRSFWSLEPTITGLINLALALSTSTSLVAFRHALATTIRHKGLDIKRGHPPPEVVEYQNFILSVFLDAGTRLEERRFLLLKYANGDWRRTDKVEVFIPAGPEFDADAVEETVIQALLTALTHTIFKVYPRHRWLGGDIAANQVGLLVAVHGIGSEAFLRMTSKHPSGGTSSQTHASHEEHLHEGDSVAEGSAATRWPRAPEGPSEARELGEQDVSQLGTPAEQVPDMEQAEASAGEKAVLQARRVKTAQHFLDSNPLAPLMLLKLAMQPLAKLLKAYITKSGQQWEREQRAKEAAFVAGLSNSRRAFKLVDFANSIEEHIFLADLEKLRSTTWWQLFPKDCFSLGFECEVFRILSRMGTLVHQLLVAPVQLCPYKTFRLLNDDGKEALAREISELRPCMVDSFTAKLVEKYPGEALFSDDAAKCVETLALCASIDTVSLEWTHGRIHRIIKSASVQTHTPSMEFVNAQYVCSQFKRRWSCSSTGQRAQAGARRRSVEAGRDAVLQSEAKKARGGGGAWRAFVSRRTRGSHQGEIDFADLGRQYQDAKEGQTPEYLECLTSGAHATERRKGTGRSGFGLKSRQVRRKLQQEAKVAGSSSAMSAGEHTALEVGLSGSGEAPVISGNIDEALLRVRQGLSNERARRSQEQKQLLSALEEHSRQYDAEEKEAALSCVPLPMTDSSSLHPQPHSSMTVLQVASDSIDQASCVAAWAAANSRHCNLAAGPKQNWQAKNATVMQPERTLIQKKKPSKKCLERGLCTCTDEGKLQLSCRNEILRHLKQDFGRVDKAALASLKEGFIVLRFAPEQDAQPQSSWSGEALRFARGQAEAGTLQAQETVWVHVGLMYFKPYRPTFQVLRPLETTAPERVRLQQTGMFHTDISLSKHLDLGLCWTLEVFEAIATSAPVGVLSPDCCWVRRFSPTRHFWPPLKSSRKRKGHAKKRSRRAAPKSKSQRAHALSTATQPSAAAQASPIQDTSDMDDSDGEHSSEADEAVWSDAATEASQVELDALLAAHLESVLSDAEEAALEVPDFAPESTSLPAGQPASTSPGDVFEPPQAAAVPLQEDAPSGEGVARAAAAEALAEPGPAEVGPVVEAVVPLVAVPAPRARQRATIVCDVPGGRLCYYAQGFFTAVCGHPNHGHCEMRRSAEAGRRQSQGRPLGHLMSWLAHGRSCGTKGDHWETLLWPSRDDRRAARTALAEIPGGQELLMAERPQEAGEDAEPDSRP